MYVTITVFTVKELRIQIASNVALFSFTRLRCLNKLLFKQKSLFSLSCVNFIFKQNIIQSFWPVRRMGDSSSKTYFKDLNARLSEDKSGGHSTEVPTGNVQIFWLFMRIFHSKPIVALLYLTSKTRDLRRTILFLIMPMNRRRFLRYIRSVIFTSLAH